MVTLGWLIIIGCIVGLWVLVSALQTYTHRAEVLAAEGRAERRVKAELFGRVRRAGVRYEIRLAESNLQWRWSVWDADAALFGVRNIREGTVGVVTPYAAGTATTRPNAEARALAEVEGLRLQERVDEVFVV